MSVNTPRIISVSIFKDLQLQLREHDDWGDNQRIDLLVMLKDVASHIGREVHSPISGSIIVEPTPSPDLDPMVLYRSSMSDPYIVQLSARDRRWSQFSYQFAHEFCHILMRFDRLKENPNQWLHESICEVASLYTLRKMAVRWRENPPFPNWAAYAHQLSAYVNQCLTKTESFAKRERTSLTWLNENEEYLRNNPYDRLKNAVIAYRLLPLFEEMPNSWNTLSRMPQSTPNLVQYLKDWQEAVEQCNKPFLIELRSRIFRPTSQLIEQTT